MGFWPRNQHDVMWSFKDMVSCCLLRVIKSRLKSYLPFLVNMIMPAQYQIHLYNVLWSHSQTSQCFSFILKKKLCLKKETLTSGTFSASLMSLGVLMWVRAMTYSQPAKEIGVWILSSLLSKSSGYHHHLLDFPVTYLVNRLTISQLVYFPWGSLVNVVQQAREFSSHLFVFI